MEYGVMGRKQNVMIPLLQHSNTPVGVKPLTSIFSMSMLCVASSTQISRDT